MGETAAWEELESTAASLKLGLPESFARQARVYLSELERWGRTGGLTGYRDPSKRIRHLLTESLMLLRVVPPPATPLVDIGSGAGIPGLILAFARPEWEIVLIESARRRANFLRHVARTLALGGVRVEHGRAEIVSKGSGQGRFRTATMRAMPGGGMARKLAAPFLAPDGVLVVTLGPNAAAPVGGRVEEVALERPGELPWRRRFLILAGAEIAAGVSRGTPGATREENGRRQPEGRRRENYDRC